MNVETICAIIGACISGIGVLCTIIYKIKASTGKSALEKVQLVNDVFAQIPGYINEAEKLFVGEKLGASKLNYVLTKLQIYALKKGVEIDESVLTEQIESVLSTPHANSRIVRADVVE